MVNGLDIQSLLGIKRLVETRISLDNDHWSSEINFLKEENKKLKKKNEELREEIDSLKKQTATGEKKPLLVQPPSSNQTTVVTSTNINPNELELFRKELNLLKNAIKNLSSSGANYRFDLKKIRSIEPLLNLKSRIVNDPNSAEIRGEILNNVFKVQLAKQKAAKPASGFTNFKFPTRVLMDKNLTIKQWITPPDSIIKIRSSITVNTLDTKNPQEKKVTLGTGTGKSTFLLRCLASHNGGATLIVPYSSLISSVLTAHNEWLSLGKDSINDLNKRVTVCPICEENHSAKFDENGKPILDEKGKHKDKYQTIHNGESDLINVFTWYEILKVLLDSQKDPKKIELIKPIVVIDEAHTDDPRYRALITGLKNMKNKNFKAIEMSATFGDLPTSGKLTGTIVDYYVSDFAKFVSSNHTLRFFEKKVIVFCDDISKLDLKILEKNKIKYLVLNDSLKEYATQIVQSMSAPLLVIANRDYSVGFSFGDVNVISTGQSQRKIVVKDKGVWKERTIEGVSDIADMMQERGRAARDVHHSACWISIIAEPGKYSLNDMKDDDQARAITEYFSRNKSNETEIESIISYNDKPKEIPSLPREEGEKYLSMILTRSLTKSLNMSEFFNPKSSEKGIRKPGQFIFKSKLLKYFNPNQFKNMLIEATSQRIKDDFQLNYEWVNNVEEEDNYVFDNKKDAEWALFLISVRSSENYKVELIPNLKTKKDEILKVQFVKYKFGEEDQNASKVKIDD